MALLIGADAGVLDTLTMLLGKAPWLEAAVPFTHWLVLGVLIAVGCADCVCANACAPGSQRGQRRGDDGIAHADHLQPEQARIDAVDFGDQLGAGRCSGLVEGQIRSMTQQLLSMPGALATSFERLLGAKSAYGNSLSGQARSGFVWC